MLLPSVGMLEGGCDVVWVESASVTLFLVADPGIKAVVNDSNLVVLVMSHVLSFV